MKATHPVFQAAVESVDVLDVIDARDDALASDWTMRHADLLAAAASTLLPPVQRIVSEGIKGFKAATTQALSSASRMMLAASVE